MFSCDLTSGRGKVVCKSMAGIRRVYFTTDDIGDPEYNDGVTQPAFPTDSIKCFDGTAEWFVYDLQSDGNSADLGNWSSDPNNGTGFFTQTLNLNLLKLDPATHKEFKLLCYGSPHVIVEDNNGQFWLMGLINGMDTTGGTAVTGGAAGDMNGYTLTMVGKERAPAPFITAATIEDMGCSDSTPPGAFTVSAEIITP